MNITVVLLTYNRANDYLAEAVRGILSQTYQNFKFFILDNHSDDSTAEYILGLNDNRITYVRHPPGKSPDYNFNSAIEMTNTKYVLVTHDDDIMESTMLEEYIKAIEHDRNLLCISSNVSLIDANNNIIQEQLYSFESDRYLKKGDYIKAFINEILWLPTPTQMFRRKEMLQIMNLKNRNRKNTTTPSGDILMNCQLNAIGSVCLLNKPLLRYRQHGQQISRHIDQSQPLLHVIDKLVNEAKKYNQIRKNLLSLHALFLRFKLQHIVFKHAGTHSTGKLKEKFSILVNYAEKHPSTWSIANSSIVLVKIAFHLLEIQMPVLRYKDKHEIELMHDTPAAIGFRQWLNKLNSGKSLFNADFSHKRIAIFGSMLLSYLIVLEAKRQGIEVVCCLDTSDARIGANVLGEPVVALSDFDLRKTGVDCIILSNERSNEMAIRSIILEKINDEIKMYSWKELAAT
jgi:glycosyltransferase involved in cell wall biosynthesis